jgi:hypothetical protein
MIEIECDAFSVVMNLKALTGSRSPGRRRPLCSQLVVATLHVLYVR